MAPAASAENHGGNQGLYDSRFEHDACGVGFVADLSGRRTHETVAQALTVLRNLDHRGAKGSDPETGDGAGILTQLPDAFFRAACGFGLPAAGRYAAGMAFLPTGDAAPAAAESGLALDRRAFCLRKRAEHEAGLYFASLSSRTVVYKGMLTALQLEPFFP